MTLTGSELQRRKGKVTVNTRLVHSPSKHWIREGHVRMHVREGHVRMFYYRVRIITLTHYVKHMTSITAGFNPIKTTTAAVSTPIVSWFMAVQSWS